VYESLGGRGLTCVDWGFFFLSSRRRHTRLVSDWSSDVCSSDLHRKLAAILFADAIGSSRLMGRDESGTVARLLEHLNRRLAPVATRCGGRVIRLTGDGGLVEFA